MKGVTIVHRIHFYDGERKDRLKLSWKQRLKILLSGEVEVKTKILFAKNGARNVVNYINVEE